VIIVIPMAGRGQRFADKGYQQPKPLIELRGRPLYAWAVESLPCELASQIVFICLDEHLRSFGLEQNIRERYGRYNVSIVPVTQVTEGQACTVLLARELIAVEQPLLIYNADTYCATDLSERLPKIDPAIAGLLGVARAEGTKWSFARVDEEGYVVETAEKRRISEWASTGLYWFARGTDFVRHADAMVAANERENGEFYIAPLYNRLIANGEKVVIDVAREFWPLGTPQDIEDFERGWPGARRAT
jgi:dTDP-glucose pyrophosphorylase